MPPLSSLPPRSDYSLFRAGIAPKWEDPTNSGGGCWVARPHHLSRCGPSHIDAHWMEAVKSVVGAQYGSGDGAVCGVVGSIRPMQNNRVGG